MMHHQHVQHFGTCELVVRDTQKLQTFKQLIVRTTYEYISYNTFVQNILIPPTKSRDSNKQMKILKNSNEDYSYADDDDDQLRSSQPKELLKRTVTTSTRTYHTAV